MSIHSVLSGRRGFDEFREIRVTKFAIEIEAELREFYGNFGGQTGSADALQNVEIVIGDRFRLGAILDVFAELSDEGGDALFGELASSIESVVNPFTGHEAGDGAAQESVARGVFAHPRVRGSLQDRAAHQAHSLSSLARILLAPEFYWPELRIFTKR